MYLNTHSYYSLRYGTISPRRVVELAEKCGLTCVALTDINSTSGCLDFIREAKESKIKPVVGIDFRNGVDQQFVMLAKNNNGFQLINEYLSQILFSEKRKVEKEAPQFKNTVVVYPFSKTPPRKLKENEFIGINPSEISKVRISKLDTSKMVMLQHVTFITKKDFNTHRLLRAIDNNILLSKLPLSEQGAVGDVMYPRNILFELYDEFPQIIKNTAAIFSQCSIDFDLTSQGEMQNQQTFTGDRKKDIELLYSLCEEGLNYRYPDMNEEIEQRIEKELDAIISMDFVSYFLINWDIVKYAREKGYFYVGRGSGANSVIAYLLRITDVDPIELDLYFERFINEYRKNPPDFDIDFSWRDRDDVTRYIFERFKNVALVATFNTFQHRGVMRELGKVFGLPKEEIDKLSRGQMKNWEHNELSNLVLKYASYIHGFPSHLSVHASGILISEKPLSYFSASFLPPKGYPTVMFDMHVAEDAALYKFDILSQRGLGKIKDTVALIKQNQPEFSDVDVHDIKRFKKDERIKHILSNADVIGCFYVESPAMRMLLKKLKVDDYLGLVAASSVIRPGVAKSGMMNQYIERFRHPELRKTAHPTMLELMPDTYGVMVYQEDVIKVAHYFAGLTLGEADKMRRGMSGKYRSRAEFLEVKEKFFENCIKVKGHTPELTAEVWRQTESFAGYAFAKGHSASYAVESYQCLFLKAYFPLEFMVATINNYGGFYSTELYMREAKKMGGKIHPPCVNQSDIQSKIIGKEIFLGMQHIKSLDLKLLIRIIEERELNGLYISFDDFINRVRVGIEQLSILIRMNSFRTFGKNKRELLWESHLKITKASKPGNDLFKIAVKNYDLPDLSYSKVEETFDQIELLGFPINNPFKILCDTYARAIPAKDLPKYANKSVWVLGYLIHRKRTATSDHKEMFFGTFLDRDGDWLDTVHFPIIGKKYPFRGKGVYRIKGIVKCEYDCVNIEVEFMEKMDVIEDPRYVEVENKKQTLEIDTNNRRRTYSQFKKQPQA